MDGLSSMRKFVPYITCLKDRYLGTIAYFMDFEFDGKRARLLLHEEMDVQIAFQDHESNNAGTLGKQQVREILTQQLSSHPRAIQHQINLELYQTK
jgi:hypothetical protein